MNEPESALSTKLILSVLFFPMFFQRQFLEFAWGVGDDLWIMIAKRVFLLLPMLGLILALWATIASALTVIIRANRTDFITALLATWWDFGRAVFAFWGGFFKFVFMLIQTIFGFLRIMILGLWVFIFDIVFLPLRLTKTLASNILNPRVPWIAVALMIVWCLFEAMIFTYVTTPLVIDTLSNLIGEQLTEGFIRIPLFLFMFFIILGSYAVLSNLTEAVESKKVGTIVKIAAVEIVAMFVEIVFLYREFVDALVPWFAQHSSGGFELGIFGTLLIAGFTWLGIRSLSWFLFASAGTPVIVGIIQGKGLKFEPTVRNGKPGEHEYLAFTVGTIEQLKKEVDWIRDRGDTVLGAFLIPPLQIVAASINFCILLISNKHLFSIPLKSLNDVMESRPFLIQLSKEPKRKGNDT